MSAAQVVASFAFNIAVVKAAARAGQADPGRGFSLGGHPSRCFDLCGGRVQSYALKSSPL